nr:hypothetical protein [Tanacetum cinerariifolium]
PPAAPQPRLPPRARHQHRQPRGGAAAGHHLAGRPRRVRARCRRPATTAELRGGRRGAPGVLVRQRPVFARCKSYGARVFSAAAGRGQNILRRRPRPQRGRAGAGTPAVALSSAWCYVRLTLVECRSERALHNG